MSEREFGRVKFWSDDRGYGFIRKEDGTDIFVHVSQCGFLPLRIADRVSFDVAENPRTGKPEAKNVATMGST